MYRRGSVSEHVPEIDLKNIKYELEQIGPFAENLIGTASYPGFTQGCLESVDIKILG